MIIESICSFFATMLASVLGSITGPVTLPFNLMDVLSTITGYGAYFIGSDLLMIFFALVTFWFSVKMSIGVFLFVWRLLPFT